jgi:hypothetical protein
METLYFYRNCSEAEADNLATLIWLKLIKKSIKTSLRDTTEGVLAVQNQIDTVIRFKIIQKSVDSYCWSPETREYWRIANRC